MLDFKRIGGEVVSAPLNDNFRKLRNDISIANTNLIFPETDAIVPTIDEMLKIENPENGQTCYVVSSGELYRFSKYDHEWHKIADFGQTFRQGFLNSGTVVLEKEIKQKGDNKTTIIMPRMLVYFKNQKGDNRYLKGMYLFEEKDFDITPFVNGANAYAIYVDVNQKYILSAGRPREDNPNLIYLGAILVNDKNEIIPHFIYTMPSIAYTQDRGMFLISKGRADGLNLVGDKGNQVNRRNGYYYDEGINYIIGETNNFPIDTDNGSNYNLKYYEPDTNSELIYVVPKNGLTQAVEVSQGLLYNKYWDGAKIADVPEGFFTIQQHLVTPTGQNIMLYGTELYNSLTDAESNINNVYGVELDFPYVEATRIIAGNFPNFSADSDANAKFFTLGRLSQVGTVSPEFADNVFKIYSGASSDTTPSSMRFDLANLQAENYNSLYNLVVAPYLTKRHLFSMNHKYITKGNIEDVVTEKEENRQSIGDGYTIADEKDLFYLEKRLADIEKEIWDLEKEGSARHEQSVRFRLFDAETRLNSHDGILEDHKNRIGFLESNKVHKKTKVNGYTLGDTLENEEAKNIVLETGDIKEGKGLTSGTNLWYTENRVSNNIDVVASREHRNTKSEANDATAHTKVNPHNLSTDDLLVLNNSDKLLVTKEEERRIRSDKLPDDTKKALADLDAKNIDSIKIDKIDGNGETSTGTITEVGKVKGIRFYNDGVVLGLSEDKNTLTVECKGQVDEDTVMFRNIYAQESLLQPELLKGYVDKSILATTANQISGIEIAGNNKYYGTDSTGTPGMYTIKDYVTTVDSGSFTDIDQVTFVPIDGSVQEKHLEPNLKNKINNNYHKIYNSGTISSAEINEFNFGNNLTVTISGHKATINAANSGSGASISKFANLDDVNVTYTGNGGKSLIINPEENGIIIADTPSLDSYMLKTVYVDPSDITKVKKSKTADLAIKATTSDNALKVNNKVVDDNKKDATVLWTASKISSEIANDIKRLGVNTYSGNSTPSDSIGKDGDIYILL